MTELITRPDMTIFRIFLLSDLWSSTTLIMLNELI